jgi:predicted ArsR family transcriptional regulator
MEYGHNGVVEFVASIRTDAVTAVDAGCPPPETGHPPTDTGAGTRERVARSLLAEGPATAARLADRLGLTPAAVRRHLDSLQTDGRVEARERAPYGPVGPRGRGRPAKVYALTAAGRDAFGQAYDTLAAEALRHLLEVGGPDAVARFAQAHVAGMERRYLPLVERAEPDQRAAALVSALTDDGYAASLDPAPTGGAQICQHHCPVAHVAAEFPQLCEAETEAFARLLGHHVQRLSTIGGGGHLCTTAVPGTPIHTMTPTATTATATTATATTATATTATATTATATTATATTAARTPEPTSGRTA